MSHKLLLSGLSAPVRAWIDALPPKTHSGAIDAIVQGYLALPEKERAAFAQLPDAPQPLTRARARALVIEHGSAAKAAAAIGMSVSAVAKAAAYPAEGWGWCCVCLADVQIAAPEWHRGADGRSCISIDVFEPPRRVTKKQPAALLP